MQCDLNRTFNLDSVIMFSFVMFDTYFSYHKTNVCGNYYLHQGGIIVSPDESRGNLGFSTVTPPPPLQRFPFGRDNLKNILVRTFKFGMWVYMGNATNAIVL